MADEIKDPQETEEMDDGIYTLTDENGKEENFEMLGSCELDGNVYYAFVPAEEESDEYVILKAVTDENGEQALTTIDDDDEFDRVADYFEDTFFSEIDYDADGSSEE